MLACARGDHAAFEQLVIRCQDGLIQFFTMLSKNHALAEDLAQEVFVRLYRSRTAYRHQGRFKTYLYRIARNLWTDHLRRENPRCRDLSLDAPDRHGNPLSGTLAAEPRRGPPSGKQNKALVQALLRLPRQQREVLLLSLIEEMTYPEIAAVLEIPAGTVKSRMHHAVRKLRALLKNKIRIAP